MTTLREIIKEQPPYSIIFEHQITRVSMGPAWADIISVWCKCGLKTTLRVHAAHVVEMVLEEMEGELPQDHEGSL